ncbi:Serine/threonine-protein kinase afc2 [Cymbomonas tetramitiformis]|uniref:Serine/threonine-protein kinase afc2 n=1 Tax=Cymbomonas tetramitiformis TaxID=36881 RepID=A0AAE0ERE9_9CHLO|nr:Serine/threonine-protein kinase afc2 [Cymbomonas tetramitiformis]
METREKRKAASAKAGSEPEEKRQRCLADHREDDDARGKTASTSSREPHAPVVAATSREAPSSKPQTKERPPSPRRPDDKVGHLVYELGESLTPRYKILSKVGEGTFGRVLECWDRQRKEYCAVKVIRNVKKYRDAAMIEIEVLRATAKADEIGLWHCVALKEWFSYHGHVCMVFEKLGLSLYDFLRKNHYRPFSMDLVREFGVQLLESVAFLHGLTLIHTDLKPENILLESLEYIRERDSTSVISLLKAKPERP